MPYYQILKQRRLDLNLSVQDVAIQTRLKPEYIRAIEENNLDLFSDDFSYVRYFIHGYCDAIGVNWFAIKDEVDAQISAYAAARDQALRQAQMKMIQSMPSAKPTRKTTRSTRRRRKRSFLSSSAGRLSRTLSWGSSNRLASLILIVAVVGIGGLFGLNAIISHQSSAAQIARAQERSQELKDKEAQTQKLAQDLQSRKSGEESSLAPSPAAAVTVTPTAQTDIFALTGVSTENPVVHFQISPGAGQTVTIYWNDQPAFSQAVSEAFTYDLNTQGVSGTAVVVFDFPSAANLITIGETPIAADYMLMDEYGTNRIQFVVEVPAAPAQSDPAQTGLAEDPGLNEAQYADESAYDPYGYGYGDGEYDQ